MTIKELRMMKGLTQAEFAKAIGIGMSTLTGYEAGKREPGAKALAAIKEMYGVDLTNTSSPTVYAPAPAEEKVEKKARKPRGKKEAPASAEKKAGWVCKICGYVYEGEELPADYICPLCKHGPEDFEKL